MTSEQPASPTTGAGYVEVTRRGGVVTARFVRSTLGTREAPAIADVLVPIIDRMGARLRTLELDLSAVTFINSLGLGLCIDLRNRARRHRARTTTVGLSEEIEALLRVMKVEDLFGG